MTNRIRWTKFYPQKVYSWDAWPLDDQAANGIAPIHVSRVSAQTGSMRLAVQAHLECLWLLLWHLIGGASSWGWAAGEAAVRPGDGGRGSEGWWEFSVAGPARGAAGAVAGSVAEVVAVVVAGGPWQEAAWAPTRGRTVRLCSTLILLLTHWGKTKWLTFGRWHFQTYFWQWKCLNFD